MNVNAAAVLALVGELYEQIIGLRQRIADLEKQLAEKG